MALTDVRDTAALGARILLDPAKHAGKSYEFTGLTTTYAEFAKVLAEVLGKPVEHIAATPEQADSRHMRGRTCGPGGSTSSPLGRARPAAPASFDMTRCQSLADPLSELYWHVAPITTKQFAQDNRHRVS